MRRSKKEHAVKVKTTGSSEKKIRVKKKKEEKGALTLN